MQPSDEKNLVGSCSRSPDYKQVQRKKQSENKKLGKPVVIAIVGNPKDFDTKALEKYGKVVKVSESKLFSDSF